MSQCILLFHLQWSSILEYINFASPNQKKAIERRRSTSNCLFPERKCRKKIHLGFVLVGVWSAAVLADLPHAAATHAEELVDGDVLEADLAARIFRRFHDRCRNRRCRWCWRWRRCRKRFCIVGRLVDAVTLRVLQAPKFEMQFVHFVCNKMPKAKQTLELLELFLLGLKTHFPACPIWLPIFSFFPTYFLLDPDCK